MEKGRMSRIISTGSMKGMEKQVTFSKNVEEARDHPEDKRVSLKVSQKRSHPFTLKLCICICTNSVFVHDRT